MLGPHITEANLAEVLTLPCAAHNALAAEEDFGRELIEDRKNSLEHESFESGRNFTRGNESLRDFTRV